jgi:hypothetical protein
MHMIVAWNLEQALACNLLSTDQQFHKIGSKVFLPNQLAHLAISRSYFTRVCLIKTWDWESCQGIKLKHYSYSSVYAANIKSHQTAFTYFGSSDTSVNTRRSFTDLILMTSACIVLEFLHWQHACIWCLWTSCLISKHSAMLIYVSMYVNSSPGNSWYSEHRLHSPTSLRQQTPTVHSQYTRFHLTTVGRRHGIRDPPTYDPDAVPIQSDAELLWRHSHAANISTF